MSRMRGAAAPLLFIASALFAGCGHQIESPPLKKGTVEPNLVCIEQLTTPVTLTGDGFTPMPSKLLEKPPTLLLPQIELDQVQTLDGTGSGGATVKVPDDPNKPADSLLHWTSEKQMSFKVVPQPQLITSPGLYDIVVTNPDQVTKTKFEGGLLAVPRPVLNHPAVPNILCDEEADQTVQLNGTGILKVGDKLGTVTMGTQSFPVASVDGCKDMPGNDSTRTVQGCTSATFVIPKGTFQPGQYDVSLTNPDPASCHSSDTIQITVVPPPKVESIVADLVCDAQSVQHMTVNGTGFLQIDGKLPSITLGSTAFTPTAIGGTCTPVAVQDSTVQTCTQLTFDIPMGALAEGDYPVVVQNPDPAGCTSLETINLHVAPPPSIAGVNPLAVCDAQGAQNVTISGTGFLQVGSTMPTVTIGTAPPFTPTSMTGCTTITGTFTEGVVQTCTGLVISVPMGTFTSGTYPVTVKNPVPADCISTETVTIKIDDPPIVTGTAPATLCQGGGNITVNGQNFLANASVVLDAGAAGSLTSASTQVNASGTQIAATFGAAGSPGTVYDVIVDNGDGCTDAPPHQKVTVVTGPIAFFADPEIVYNDINTGVTIYLTTFKAPPVPQPGSPDGTVIITPHGDPVTSGTKLDWTTVTGHPNRIQAIVPKGEAPGAYDLWVNDLTGCQTMLPNAITVTNTTTVTIKSVDPSFAYQPQDTSVTVYRDTAAASPNNAPFVATPRLFLNPTVAPPPPAQPVAISVQAVSFSDADTLTAVVPRGQATGLYDLIVVNPDSTVGVLKNAFTIMSTPPPVITSISPSGVAATTGTVLKVAGQNLSTTATYTSECKLAGTDTTPLTFGTPTNTTCVGTSCTAQSITVTGASVAGAVCVVTITNPDGSYYKYSAIGVFNSSLNLPVPTPGQSMTTARRALVAGAGQANSSSRFVYAIGGDDGAATPTSLSSTEFSQIDIFGTKMEAWVPQGAQGTLGTPRSFAASATVGRYMYVFGGFDGTNILSSGERAMILSPQEVPYLDVGDMVPDDTLGLDPGYWYYRVSAKFAANDLDNPGGESLPSDEFIVKVPSFAPKKIKVVLTWTAPTDLNGAALPNVAGYNVYRTAAVNGSSGGEVLLATVSGGTTLTYTDDGTATPGTQTPLPLGSTGKWAPLPSMGTARMGAAGAAGFDPTDPTKLYIYALLGKDTATSAVTSYEHLPVTVQANGHQVVGAAWTAGSVQSKQARWQIGAWSMDSTTSQNIAAPTTYVYIGGGLTAANGAAGTVEVGTVSAGGDLGTLYDSATTTPVADRTKDFPGGNFAGYGVCGANNQLFLFGGAGGAPDTKAVSATINPVSPGLASNSWNAGILLGTPRYLMGSAVQSAFVFLVGGATTTVNSASNTTELVIW